MRARIGRARRAAVRRVRERGLLPGTAASAGAASSTPSGPAVGMVEHFSRRLVVGWISLPADAPPARVSLVADDFVLASTYATASSAMSGSHSALRAGTAEKGGTGGRGGGDDVGTAEDPRHDWQGTLIKGPDDDRRNSTEQIRVFSFRVRGIWPYVGRRTRLSVQVDGRPLPIFRHGTFLQPRGRGKHTLHELREKFAEGYLLNQQGQVALSRTLDRQWQDTMLRLHHRVHDLVAEKFGHRTFAIYGTLLGAVREGGPIGHDADFDTAYLSEHTHGARAAEELVEVALALVADGLEVECGATALHVSDPGRPGERIDLFHCYFDDDGAIAFPFGVAGTTPFTRDDWGGLTATPFLHDEILVPVGAEKLVAHLYGDDWRRPKPGFNWAIDRTGWSVEGRLSTEQQTKVHWANFYSRNRFTDGSSFCRFVLERDDAPGHLVDIGCGDGRDARALAAAGKTVLGLDASPEGVRRARESAREAGLDERASFEVCDVTDLGAVERLLGSMTGRADGPVGFYLRFFLHAIPEQAQDDLLRQVAASARPGDLLLAEFRTLGDEGQHKAHGKHYRRYQDAEVFREQLGPRYGFAVEYFQESRGLSPYGDEDPMLCRVVARRADTRLLGAAPQPATPAG